MVASIRKTTTSLPGENEKKKKDGEGSSVRYPKGTPVTGATGVWWKKK